MSGWHRPGSAALMFFNELSGTVRIFGTDKNLDLKDAFQARLRLSINVTCDSFAMQGPFDNFGFSLIRN